jgi:hypothetical protein
VHQLCITQPVTTCHLNLSHQYHHPNLIYSQISIINPTLNHMHNITKLTNNIPLEIHHTLHKPNTINHYTRPCAKTIPLILYKSSRPIPYYATIGTLPICKFDVVTTFPTFYNWKICCRGYAARILLLRFCCHGFCTMIFLPWLFCRDSAANIFLPRFSVAIHDFLSRIFSINNTCPNNLSQMDIQYAKISHISDPFSLIYNSPSSFL